MKLTDYKSILGKDNMKSIAGGIAFGLLAIAAPITLSAQNSAPAPGSGGGFNPAPANGIGWNPGGNSAPAPGAGGSFQPAPPAGPAWGGPWGGGWQSSPAVVFNIAPSLANSGVTSVVGVGYDAQGVWRTVPMRVAYNYNGAYYNVEVLSAWNPWTDMWNRGVDQQAFSTSYFLNGQTYDYYAPLSTGTYYFNL
ncbi:MAG: hypothetical protein K2M88_00895 [Muribaculaceae bacterium]|nr:hypothetical protein [Muribaculaceae bacterium]